jgi:hypothetical protein
MGATWFAKFVDIDSTLSIEFWVKKKRGRRSHRPRQTFVCGALKQQRYVG